MGTHVFFRTNQAIFYNTSGWSSFGVFSPQRDRAHNVGSSVNLKGGLLMSKVTEFAYSTKEGISKRVYKLHF